MGESAAAPLIAARGITRGFDSSGVRLEILRAVDFDLAVGETVAITGASGIGKSTLLHILGVLDRPEGGTLTVGGEDVLRFDAERMARFRNRTIGFVFQFHHLLAEFSALENVMLPALIAGQGRGAAGRAGAEMLERVGLGGRAHQRVVKLSGGEQQRVALARALVLRPPLLLADEPTGNLDQHNSRQVHQLLLELNRERRMALVVVTHNMELAALMSRRVTISGAKLVETNRGVP
jgi:lipoprotein-releasing system ATP-binding protein